MGFEMNSKRIHNGFPMGRETRRTDLEQEGREGRWDETVFPLFPISLFKGLKPSTLGTNAR